jgi:hypothetical protein
MNIVPSQFSQSTRARFRLFVERMRREWGGIESDGLRTRLPQFLGPVLVCGAAGTAVCSLPHVPYLLAAMLIGLMALKHRFFPMRLDWLCFTVLSLGGPFSETQIILASRPWAYSEPQFGVVPVWLAPLWGLVGMCLLTSYHALTQPVVSKTTPHAPSLAES